MEIERMDSEMDYVPVDLQVRKLGGVCYEILRNENVIAIVGEDGRSKYTAETVLLTAKLNSQSEALTALKRMKYSQDEEIELTNVGIDNPFNTDYKKYREYVTWCKEQCPIYFPELV